MSNYPPPPPPRRGGSGDYPPPSGQSYPPPEPPPWGPPPQAPYPPIGTGPLTPPPAFDDHPFKDEFRPFTKRSLGRSLDELRNPMSERRIEYFAWGLVVLLAGCGIILLAVDRQAVDNILLIVGPLMVGGVLFGSGFLQRLVFGFDVSLVTWGVAVLSTAFGLTQLIAFLTDRTGTDHLQNQAIYFVGLMVILAGVVIIMQVFRPPHNS